MVGVQFPPEIGKAYLVEVYHHGAEQPAYNVQGTVTEILKWSLFDEFNVRVMGIPQRFKMDDGCAWADLVDE
jgi:hypothetical protein